MGGRLVWSGRWASPGSVKRTSMVVGLQLGHAKCATLSILGDCKRKQWLVNSNSTFTANDVPLNGLFPGQTYRFPGLEISPTRGRAELGWTLASINRDLRIIQKAPFKPQQKLWAIKNVLVPSTDTNGCWGTPLKASCTRSTKNPPARKPLPRVRKPNLHSDRGQDSNMVVELMQPLPKALTAYTMAKRCATGLVRASAGIAATSQAYHIAVCLASKRLIAARTEEVSTGGWRIPITVVKGSSVRGRNGASSILTHDSCLVILVVFYLQLRIDHKLTFLS
ncbi:hypothetical protein E2C01_020682 [Portunus trituberculatus]|uniref:Uncharacterized protein n=1 Tax=Portunus trituberculatus TaxID=210409 RepID=A0A5B7E0J6_PORTR|nr:hypothetical protein [Portunus trituberculatus]